jgi:hypothetical protein
MTPLRQRMIEDMRIRNFATTDKGFITFAAPTLPFFLPTFSAAKLMKPLLVN